MRSALFILMLIATLALAAGAQAMSSTSYKIEWLMASIGSGETSSTYYRTSSPSARWRWGVAPVVTSAAVGASGRVL